jgi:hypothetical protein
MNINIKEKPMGKLYNEATIYSETKSDAVFSKKGFIVQVNRKAPELGEFHFVPKGFSRDPDVPAEDRKREYMINMVKSLTEGWEEFIKFREEHPESSLARIHYLSGITNNKFADFIVKNFGAGVTGEYGEHEKKLIINLDDIKEKLKLFKERYKQFIEK